ncbi:hypothetical protein C8R44DRAFT_978392 [Mycena epipterygia]|nr:hypothetical protein C8R44DRAFT_978392 [Mycena epipterygia]
MASIHTSRHSYPVQEIRAMENFYGGKRCCITKSINSVEWSHQLNAAAISSKLQWMLERNLRENRHPTHGAEVRENLVPLSVTYHKMVDKGATGLTLFPHEDVVAKTLEYELDVREWRLNEVNAGRGDPGRPSYISGYPAGSLSKTDPAIGPVLPCRLHMSARSPNPELILVQGTPPKIYPPDQCPGYGADDQFPIINTLLSIPFAILHQTPRLSALMPIDQYQAQMVNMATEIMFLYGWDPVVAAPISPSAVSVRAPPPCTIMERKATFQSMLPYLESVDRSGEGNGRRVRLRSLPPRTPSPHHSQLLAVAELPDGSFPGCTDKNTGIGVSAADSCLQVLDTAISDIDNSSGRDVSGEDLAETESTWGFIRGTVNEALMIRGCIDPAVYIQYADLERLKRTKVEDIRI